MASSKELLALLRLLKPLPREAKDELLIYLREIQDTEENQAPLASSAD